MVIKGIIKNRRGWIEIMEVFVTILLLTSVLFVVIGNSSSKAKLITPIIYGEEIAILRDIGLNNTLRTEILGATLPIEWNQFSSELPEVEEKISSMTPTNLECIAKLCALDDLCVSDEFTSENIYVKSLMISADLDTYSPRQLKIFCGEKTA